MTTDREAFSIPSVTCPMVDTPKHYSLKTRSKSAYNEVEKSRW